MDDESNANGRPLLQIAPMLDVSYEDFRQYMRLLTRRAQIWTEMIVDHTLLFSQKEGRGLGGFLDFQENEHSIVCQLGGSDPSTLAEAAQVVERWGYDEVNLNVGCPSDRVAGKGEFGASLMKRPEHVRDCVHAMRRAVQIPVTVKTRLGVDDLDSQEFTKQFVSTVAQSGCRHFVMHARKAWLSGLSPAQNRTVPPLQYDRVASLCNDFPDLEFSINGGILSLEHAKGMLTSAPKNLLGVMVGRLATNNPCLLWDVDRYMYNEAANPLGQSATRRTLAQSYAQYLEKVHPPTDELAKSRTHLALKPILGLLSGRPGHRHFRQTLETLQRDKLNRCDGPAALLRLALESLDKDDKSRAALDEQLTPAGEPHLLDSQLMLCEVESEEAHTTQQESCNASENSSGVKLAGG